VDDQDLSGIYEALDQIIERQRTYAAFRELGPKELKEVDTVRDLFNSLKESGDLQYRGLRGSLADPPDCIAVNGLGHCVGIEVTEFVSEEAIRLNEAQRRKLGRRPEIREMVMAEWTEVAFLDHMTALLDDKDAKVLIGGPFAEYIVVVHTDEPLLIRRHVEAWVADHVFGPHGQITAAYLLFSYEPGSGYPFVQLQLG
jgi:hypothetical protein